MSLAIGIDLGTARCAVGVFEHGKAAALLAGKLPYALPSAIGFAEDGAVFVGDRVRRLTLTRPQAMLTGVRRWIGRRFDELDMQAWRPYTLVRADSGDARGRGRVGAGWPGGARRAWAQGWGKRPPGQGGWGIVTPAGARGPVVGSIEGVGPRSTQLLVGGGQVLDHRRDQLRQLGTQHRLADVLGIDGGVEPRGGVGVAGDGQPSHGDQALDATTAVPRRAPLPAHLERPPGQR